MSDLTVDAQLSAIRQQIDTAVQALTQMASSIDTLAAQLSTPTTDPSAAINARFDALEASLAALRAELVSRIAALEARPVPAPDPDPDPVPDPDPIPDPDPVPDPIPVPDPTPLPNPSDVSLLITLVNETSATLPARFITFGKTFLKGQVPSTYRLVCFANGGPILSQMDVKTTYPDGFIRHAIVTIKQPDIAPNASVPVTFTANEAPATASPVNLASRVADLDMQVALTARGGLGVAVGIAHVFDVGPSLRNAITSGMASPWLHGPLVSESRGSIAIGGSMRIVFDVAAYVDGTYRTDVQFCNDGTMQQVGGKMTYDSVITWAGVTVDTQVGLGHYQYQTWHKTLWSGGEPPVTLRHDIASLIKAGSILPFRIDAPLPAQIFLDQAIGMSAPDWGQPLAPNGVTKYMPTTGGRADIGATTLGVAVWLIRQDKDSQKYALAQADASGAVPWHFFDVADNRYLTLDKYPTLWADGRGTPTLTQPVTPPGDDHGWTPDTSHQPDLTYVPYLLTGSRYYLDQLNAQATFNTFVTWNFYRKDALGIIANGFDQVRGQAWGMRALDRAAHANPDGSREKEYYSRISANNWTFLNNQIPAWTAQQGEAYGQVAGGYGDGFRMAPWQQDFFATTAAQSALMGISGAASFLTWMETFLVGRFQAAAKGFSPYDGVAYNMITIKVDGATRTPLMTWDAIGKEMAASGASNYGSWSNDGNVYAYTAIPALISLLHVADRPATRAVLSWLLSTNPPHGTAAELAGMPNYNLAMP